MGKMCEKKALNLGIPKADLYDYFLEVLDGSALEIVDTPTQDENTYEEALECLDKRFLNPTLYTGGQVSSYSRFWEKCFE